MTCDHCHADPCLCGPKRESKRPFYYRECATPGCSVMIGARIGTPIEPEICKWCFNNVAYNQREPKEVRT